MFSTERGSFHRPSVLNALEDLLQLKLCPNHHKTPRMNHIGARRGLGQWIRKCCAFENETRKNYSINLFISSFNTPAFDTITFFPRSFRSLRRMVKCKSERQTNNERNKTEIMYFFSTKWISCCRHYITFRWLDSHTLTQRFWGRIRSDSHFSRVF